MVALKFGKIGREEGCLFMLYKNRGIEIKILNKRMFGTIEVSTISSKSSRETTETAIGIQKPELKPPARSRIFAEQLEVDKEKSSGTYNNYQKDALRLKILVDTNYLKLMDRGMISENKKVKIHADIEGLGPVFKVRLELTNQGQKPLTDLVLGLQFNKANYKVLDSIPEVKFLLPNVMMAATLKIRNISPLGSNEDIKVFISHKQETKPIAGAVINMPVCDPTMNL